jgi:hypothetical protein
MGETPDERNLAEVLRASKRLRLALAITGLLCVALIALLIHASVRNAQLQRSVDRMYSQHGQARWAIMSSYGLIGKKIRVQVGTAKYVEFLGTGEWDSYASWLGPASVAALPATGRDEKVVVSVNDSVVFDRTLNRKDGLFLVIQGEKDGSCSVQQAKALIYE